MKIAKVFWIEGLGRGFSEDRLRLELLSVKRYGGFVQGLLEIRPNGRPTIITEIVERDKKIIAPRLDIYLEPVQALDSIATLVFNYDDRRYRVVPISTEALS